MGPLAEVREWSALERQLQEARSLGIEAVSVDVWWGAVETADDRLDWSYYRELFATIARADLQVIAIVSLHRCGGGPGDDCDIPLPEWLFEQMAEAGLSRGDVTFASESGRVLADAVSPWATERAIVLAEIEEFMTAFAETFATDAEQFVEINLSLGPTGELRYPAYNREDGWPGTSDRGNFQAYSSLARADFRAWALAEFGGLDGVEQRWGLQLRRAENINPPQSFRDRQAADFVESYAYRHSQYGRDFIDWYHSSLVEHGRRLIEVGDRVFSGPYESIPIGVKIPGIHWQMQDCVPHPRLAEITTGLVPVGRDLDRREAVYGYANILDMLAEAQRDLDREIILHFTALEMDDDPTCPGQEASLARTLAGWIAEGASDRGLRLQGENALAAGVNHPSGWDRIEETFRETDYSGLTLLRLGEWNDVARHRYREFIDEFSCDRPEGAPTHE